MTSAPDTAAVEAAIAEATFRLLVDSVHDYAIFLLDRGGRVATWNAGAQLIKGYAPEEIIGKHIATFYPPEDREAGKPQRLLQTAALEGRVEDEGWRVRSDGRRFWADVVITAVRDPAGELTGFAKVTRDLTSRRETEEALRRTQEQLSTTLYSIGDGVLATDERGHITLINRVAEELTGWPEDEARGRPIDEVFDIVDEDTRAKAVNPVGRVLKEGIVVGLANHTALVARDGTERPIADSGAPIRDAHGRTCGAVLVFRDVTDERKAEQALRESEQRLRLMIESVKDYAIYMLDPHGNVVSWNAGAERIKGWRAKEIVGESFERFFVPEEVEFGTPQRELDVAAEHGRFEDEAWRVRKDGSRFWANVVLTAIRDEAGLLVGFAKVTRDLTERRKLEQERVRAAQAEEAVRLRDEFLSIASHELKTPLTALQLQLDALRDLVPAEDPKLSKKVARAMRASERLGDLVESLLDVSRISTGTLVLEREALDLVEVARDVIDRVEEAAVDAGCTVALQSTQPVRGRWDRRRIEQILMNLLANAFKHAPGTAVTVTARQEAGAAVIEVRDGGPGLREADLSRVFERFERASPTSHGGLGLGLYVARKVAEAHGGTISAHNVEGKGACFVVRLPF